MYTICIYMCMNILVYIYVCIYKDMYIYLYTYIRLPALAERLAAILERPAHRPGSRQQVGPSWLVLAGLYQGSDEARRGLYLGSRGFHMQTLIIYKLGFTQLTTRLL